MYFSSSNFGGKWQKIKWVKMKKQRTFGYMWNIIEKIMEIYLNFFENSFDFPREACYDVCIINNEDRR